MFKEDLLKNKVILVTGGGTGLGKSMATRFGELGANLVIGSRRADVITNAAQELEQTGVEVLGVKCDVRQMDQVNDMVSAALDKFGQIDILLNNAAGNFISPTEMLSAGGFKAVVDIVLVGTFNCTLAVGKEMIKQKKWKYIKYSYYLCLDGVRLCYSLCICKSRSAGNDTFLGCRVGKINIRSNAIAPGPFPTEGAWKRLVPPGLNIEKKMKKRVPLKRFGEHIELANLASYLISDQAGYINGEVVTIDGGEWLKGAGQFNELDKLPKALWKTMQKLRKRSKK
ncbi:MAG: short-chain dehydrogenase [Candidatus Neomarinimicrobiota bacterium]|nr:MAG: short-chain dehydrogenase [Candidatus Neomarinimicrobiota bacterium]